MRRDLIKNFLTDNQSYILEAFIKQFLPKRGNKRKHSGNELESVCNTIDRIIKQNFGFNLTPQNILRVFIKLDYDIFTKKGDWNWDTKEYKPSNIGETKTGDGYSDFDAMFIYIDIDPINLRELKLATCTMPPNTGEPKILLKQKQQARIESFKKKILTH